MPIRVVTEAPFVGANQYAEVPFWDDLNKKADVGWVNQLDGRLNGKADINFIDRVDERCGSIERSLGGKVDKKAAAEAAAQLISEIEKGQWHEHFKQFAESQTRRFERALEAQHGRFGLLLEAFRKEAGAASELPERIQQAVENHRREMAALLKSFTKVLEQKAVEISGIHQACVTVRDDMRREPEAIRALQSEISQAREISAMTAARFKSLEAISATFWTRLRWLVRGQPNKA